MPQQPRPQPRHRQAVSRRSKRRPRRPPSQSPCCFRHYACRARPDQHLRRRSQCICCISRHGISQHRSRPRCRLRWTQSGIRSRSPSSTIDRRRTVQKGALSALPPLSACLVRVLLLLQVQGQDGLHRSRIEGSHLRQMSFSWKWKHNGGEVKCPRGNGQNVQGHCMQMLAAIDTQFCRIN